jgi:hypothetical protein
MKTSLILVIACISTVSLAAENTTGPDVVTVRILDRPLPSEEDKKRDFLWDNFANTPDEKQFSSYTTEKWQDKYQEFAATLLRKAGDQKLDTHSLRRALDLVLAESKNKIAYLPIGAFQTTLDEKPVWIITVKWEFPFKDKANTFGHIRMYVYDQKTLKLVGFNTCM